MADSQMRVALTNLGADVRADFYQTLAIWQNGWLSPARPSDWLATDHLVAEVGSVQAPFDSLLDLQRFLTAGFLPSADLPHAESVPAADRTSTASILAAPGRAPSATLPTAEEQATYRLPSFSTDRTRGTAVPVDMHPPAASSPVVSLQQPPTPGRAWATLLSTSTPSPDPRQPGTPTPDTMHGSGLRSLPQPGPSSALPLPAQTSDPRGADEPPSWAAPPTRIGGLRDLAQRLPADFHPSAPWADSPTAPASRTWLAHRTDMPAPHAEESLIAASTSPAVSSLTRALSQAPGTEDSAATLPPVKTPTSTAPTSTAPTSTAPTSTAPTAYVLHGQSEQIPAPAPAATIPPVHATLSQVDTLMDALAREITREYHRFYGA